jgi:hypothetical protein
MLLLNIYNGRDCNVNFLKCKKYLHKGKKIPIFNVQINEKWELIFNHFSKRIQNHLKVKVKLN